ncbi:potassium voltage-gated channel subfamily E member 2-like [Brachyhypopomus gauderio]|uniref:potassium voltage-gated channel subfamily E member 2-like n=1 Tax=Brachyhypopomus gauderio TaxID=698409 RepID=UPI0040415944
METLSKLYFLHMPSTGTKANMTKPSDWSNLTQHLQDSLSNTLSDILDNWQRNLTQGERSLDARLAEENFRNVIWYLVVMMGMFAFIVVAILVSTVKSKRREHSDDPYHKYIEGEWNSQPPIQAFNQSFVISNPTHRTFDGLCSP